MASEQALPIEQLVIRIQQAMQAIVEGESGERAWVTYSGAVSIDPRHLSYCVCVETDAEKKRLESRWPLRNRLFGLLVENGFPDDCRDSVRILFESQETVDRESGGNWYRHWK